VWDPWRGSWVEVFMTRSRNRGERCVVSRVRHHVGSTHSGRKRKMQVLQNAVIAKCRVPTEDESQRPPLASRHTLPVEWRVYREAWRTG